MGSNETKNQHSTFVEQLTLNRNRLYAFIRSLVHNASDAEDIFQKTSVTIWQKSVAGEPPRDFVAFFCQIARGHVLDHYKQKRREKNLFSEKLIDLLTRYQTETEQAEDSVRLDALRRCVDDLPASQRELLKQHYQEQEAIARIANSQDRTVHSVHSSLRHIRAKLLGCIQWRLSGEEDVK